jgi:RNA-binding protein NOB1
MQNTLLQIGLAALSVEGLAIKRAHHWALQCHGCRTLVRDTAKLFCPACGHNTLLKVSLRVDAKGQVTTRPLRRGVSAKGTRFAMPMPTGGRTEVKIVTAEDQLPRHGNKTTDASDADHLFFASRAPASQHGRFLVGGKEGPRKNPNHARRKKV